MTSLLTADVHWTSDPKEAYRWDLIEWLIQKAKEERIDNVIILGDLTVKKDNHPSALVNRLCLGLSELARVAHVFINKGNHDFVDPKTPFFGFLERMPKIRFFTEPTVVEVRVAGKPEMCLFLPSSPNPNQ